MYHPGDRAGCDRGNRLGVVTENFEKFNEHKERRIEPDRLFIHHPVSNPPAQVKAEQPKANRHQPPEHIMHRIAYVKWLKKPAHRIRRCRRENQRHQTKHHVLCFFDPVTPPTSHPLYHRHSLFPLQLGDFFRCDLTNEGLVPLLARDVKNRERNHLILLRKLNMLQAILHQILHGSPAFFQLTQLVETRPATHQFDRILRATTRRLDHLTIHHHQLQPITEITDFCRLYFAFQVHTHSSQAPCINTQPSNNHTWLPTAESHAHASQHIISTLFHPYPT